MTARKIFKTSALVTTAIISLQTQADQQFNDDVVIKGSVCIGLDCVNGENFSFDTIRLKENNVRIKFQDTSATAGFPSNDWQLTANDSQNGGANRFSIDDIDGAKTPFTVEAGARTNALYIDDMGRIGVGTNAPIVNVHIKEGNTPTLRLEQDGSSGFAAQTWDVAGNETNFFVRDATSSGTLPFRIQSGASNASIFIASDGDVGFETTTPDGQFDVAHSTDVNNHAFLIDPSSNVGINIDNGYMPNGLFDVQTTGGVSQFTIENDGDIKVSNGQLKLTTNASDIERLGQKVQFGVMSGSGSHNRSVFATSDASDVIEIEYRSNNQQKWVQSSRNSLDNDKFVFFNGSANEVLTLFQSGNVHIGGVAAGVSDTSGRLINTASGAYLSSAGVWTDASSRTLKKDVTSLSLEQAIKALKELNPVTFNYKRSPDDLHVGFIAEDVPELVATLDRKGLASMDILAVLTKVVKEQQETIEKLENLINKK